MADAQAKILLTGDDLLKMSEEATEGYELIEGELVKMVPTGVEHSNVENGTAFQLTLFNKQHKLGRILTGKIGFYIRGNDRTVRAADVAFISYERLPVDASLEGYSRIAPDLVVEVISPGNTAEEMEEKVREWFDFGVQVNLGHLPQNPPRSCLHYTRQTDYPGWQMPISKAVTSCPVSAFPLLPSLKTKTLTKT
jgi:Uma2 family endonuclease